MRADLVGKGVGADRIRLYFFVNSCQGDDGFAVLCHTLVKGAGCDAGDRSRRTEGEGTGSETARREMERRKMERREMERKEIERKEIEKKEIERREMERREI